MVARGGSQSDCWSVCPEVRPDNRETWALYQLYETRWEWGAGGYRVHYDSTELMSLAKALGYKAPSLLDLARRIKVIETTMLVIEGDRFKADEQRREAEAALRESQAIQNNILRR